jgi:hypothetical protein
MLDPYTYYVESVPERLRITSLLDHGRLLSWIMFRFSLLKYYLWRALKADYSSRDMSSLARALSQPEVKTLIFMSAFHGTLGAITLSIAASFIQGTAVNWQGLAQNSLAGLVFSLMIAFWICLQIGLGIGIALGAVMLVFVTTAFGSGGGIQPSGLWLVILLVALETAAATPQGVVRAMVAGDARVLGYGIFVAIGIGIIAGIGLSIVIFASPSTPLELAIMTGFLVAPGVLMMPRFIIYPVELLWIAILNLLQRNLLTRAQSHPGLWDEILTLPAIGLNFLLLQILAKNLAQGLALTRQIVNNPFQRWVAQRAFVNLVYQSSDPIEVLYVLLKDPHLQEVASFRVTEERTTSTQSVRAVLLAEMGGQIAYTSSRATQQFAYYFSLPFRDRRITPVYQLSKLLYWLLDEELVNAPGFSLRSYHSQYESVSNLPHGMEISQSFSTLAEFIEWDSIEQVASAPSCLAWTDELTDVLRPEIVQTLKGLAEVGAEVATYQVSSSRVNRLAALSRATAGLDALATRTSDQVHLPETTLLLRIIRQWQSLTARASGRLGEEALHEMLPLARQVAGGEGRRSVIWQRPMTPIPNPYKAGEPVYPPLFVGRKDIFDRIGEVWSSKKNPDSIILYGHRRMGKTSILRNLDQYAPPGSIPVFLDLKGTTSFVQSTADFLLGVADAIHSTVRSATAGFDAPMPDPSDYSSPARAQFHMDRLLRQVQAVLAERQLILGLDEFEAIEDAVRDGRVGQEIYQYLRAKTQEPWLTVVFAGLHKLDEMSREYQEPFYGSYVNICVSYLNREAAHRLITNPIPDFQVDHDPDVVERVIAETHGQPMLVQYICQELINHLNHELFDLNREREVRIGAADLQAVLTDDFLRREARYFDGVWSQVRGQPDQVAALTTMAHGPTAWTADELADAVSLPRDNILQTLEQLRRRDILAPLDGAPERWNFLVPLMRHWVSLVIGKPNVERFGPESGA